MHDELPDVPRECLLRTLDLMKDTFEVGVICASRTVGRQTGKWVLGEGLIFFLYQFRCRNALEEFNSVAELKRLTRFHFKGARTLGFTKEVM